MPVEIKYNGLTIANLEGGQTATLPCNGKKMKSDLTVIAPEGGGGGSGVLGARTFNEERAFPEGSENYTDGYQLNVEGFLSWEFILEGYNCQIYCTFNSIVLAADVSDTSTTKLCMVVPVVGVINQAGATVNITQTMFASGVIAYCDVDGVKHWFMPDSGAETSPTIIVTKCNNAEAEAWLLANTTAVE